jgi:hypothetical protein
MVSSIMPAASSEYRETRARYSSLRRHRDADHPDVIEARRSMEEAALINAIQKALAKAPQLSDQFRARIAALLSIGSNEIIQPPKRLKAR